MLPCKLDAEHDWGEAPAEPHAMEGVIFHAAQQELRPLERCSIENRKKLALSNLQLLF